MLRKLLALLLVFAIAGLFIGGCKGKGEEPAPMEQYRKQAEKDINAKNAESELQKLQKEIDADTE